MTYFRLMTTASSLALAGALQFLATPAAAQCVVTSGGGTAETPASGATVECRGGLDPDGITNATATDVTVTFFGDGSGVATRGAGEPGIELGAGADVNVTNDNRVNTRGNDSPGVVVGDGSNVNVGGSVTTRGDNSTAITIGNNSTVTVTNDSEASAGGAGSNAIVTGSGATLELGGLSSTTGMAGNAVVVGANSSVQVNGTVDTQAQGANALVINGGTNVNVGGGSSGTGSVTSASKSAILVRGSGNAIDVQSNGRVSGTQTDPTIRATSSGTSTDILVRAGGTIDGSESIAIQLAGTDNEVTVQGGTTATPTAGAITAEGGQAILGSDTGSDTINVGGVVRGGTQTLATLDLRGGNDTLNINDGASIRGNGQPKGDGGAGTDTLNVQGNNTINSSDYVNFEQVNVGSGSTFTVDDAQTNRSTTTTDGGTTNVTDGGSSGSTTADGGTVNVQDGGNSGTTTATNGGTVNVGSGGSSGTTTADGGTVNVSDGGSTGDTTSTNGGTVNVGNGGSTGTTTADGGTVNVTDGGSSGTTSATNGGTVNVGSGGSATVGDGATSSGGTVNFADGSTLNAQANTGSTYSAPEVTAISGLTVGNNVTTTVNNSQFLTATAQNGSIEISRDADAFANASVTSNQRSVGAALDALADSGDFGDELVGALLFSANEGDVTLNALSGEIYAAQLQGALTGGAAFGQTLRRTAGGHALAPHAEIADGWRLWAGGLGQSASFDATDDTLDIDSSYAGLMVGAETSAADLGLGSGVVGVALAYGQLETTIPEIASTAEGDLWQLGVYGATQSGPLSVSAALTYGVLDSDVTRRFPGDLEGPVARSNSEGRILTLSAEASYDLGTMGQMGGYTIAPLATLDLVQVDIDGSRETGGGVFGLNASDGSATALIGGLGVSASQTYVANGNTISPEVRVVLKKNLSDDSFATRSLAFNGASDTRFDVTSPAVDDTWVSIGAGVTVTQANGMRISARYDGNFAENATSHTLGVLATLSF